MASRVASVVSGVLMSVTAAFAVCGCAVVQEKTVGESLDEAAAGTEIKTRLFAKGGIEDFGEVDVEVADRFVLLSGRVPSEALRLEAERIAMSVGSVDEVANELVIDRRNIGRDINDRWITEQIRARLVANSAIKGFNYNIQVYDGNVYLLGLAESEDELRNAAEQAARVKGVQKVVSYVKLRDRSATRATSPTSIETGEPAPLIEIAPDSDAPAPIVPPDRQPSQRGAYPDPYGPGAASLTPSSGGSSSGSSVDGLQSAPLTPIVP